MNLTFHTFRYSDSQGLSHVFLDSYLLALVWVQMSSPMSTYPNDLFMIIMSDCGSFTAQLLALFC